MIYAEAPSRRRPRKLTARWKRQERCFFMTTNLAKWASNNGQIIKSGLPNDRRAKFLPSVVGFAYDLLRYEYYLGNIGLSVRTGCRSSHRQVRNAIRNATSPTLNPTQLNCQRWTAEQIRVFLRAGAYCCCSSRIRSSTSIKVQGRRPLPTRYIKDRWLLDVQRSLC